MIINFDKNNIDKLKGKGKVIKAGLIAGALGLSLLLSGCNRTVFDTKYGFDKAFISGEDSSIVLDVREWKDYSGEQLQLTTNDNFVLLTSAFKTSKIVVIAVAVFKSFSRPALNLFLNPNSYKFINT